MDKWIHDLVNTSGFHALIVAAVLLVITTVISRYAVRLVRKLLLSDGAPLPSSSLIVNVVRIAIWAVGLSFMLSSCFNVDVGGLMTAIGVGGVALSLGMQDTLANFIGGLQVTLMKLLTPGDHVKIGATEGMVLDVTWRQTVVKDFENTIHTIPNSSINSGEIEKIEPAHLVSTTLAFTNDTRDLDETIRTMERVAKEAVEQIAELERDPWILLTQIGEYGTWAKMRFVLKDMTNVREVRDAALRAVSPYTRMNPEDMADRA
ncbi:MAG: mechanosensitive ion channel family protein [Atopobiaceae bacterium]|nr:mechanosensitive ion channel family protein [Atopobiaceae bacterium]